MKTFYVLSAIALSCTMYLTGCTTDSSANSSASVKENTVAQLKPLNYEEISPTRLNHFFTANDRICVTKAFDGASDGITYKNSGAYVSVITYNNFAQHTANTYVVEGYDPQSSQAEAMAKGCNILVQPRILYWGGQRTDSKNVILELNTYDVSSLNLLNQAKLTGRTAFDTVVEGSDKQSIAGTVQTYIHWLYQNY